MPYILFFIFASLVSSIFSNESPFRSIYQYGKSNDWRGLSDETMIYFDENNPTFRKNFEDYSQYKQQNPSCNCYTSELVKQLLIDLLPNTKKPSILLKNIKEFSTGFRSEGEFYLNLYDKFLFNNLIYNILEMHYEGLFPYYLIDVVPIVERDDEDDEDAVDSLLYDQYGYFLNYILFRYAFFYSSFRDVFQSLIKNSEEYVQKNLPYAYNPNNPKKISEVYCFLNSIQEYWLGITEQCTKIHPHPKIYYERGLAFYDQGNFLEAIAEIEKMITLGQDPRFSDTLTSEMYHKQGQVYADVALYDQAIEALTYAIQKEPTNQKAYFERALCYLENGDYQNSAEDFLLSKTKVNFISSSDMDDLSFAKGLIAGTMRGSIINLKEFAPSMCSSLYGIGHGLWAFACEPIEISKDLIQGCFSIVNYINTHNFKEISAVLAPEINELATQWNSLNFFERGDKMGFIIGKYGVDIFANLALVKGFKYYKNLKRANSIQTLEAMKNADKFLKIENASKSWWKETSIIIDKLKQQGGRLDQNLAKAFKNQRLNELQVRKILHTAGFKTFPRPKGIPDNFVVEIAEKSGGMIYTNPLHAHTSIRVMPGKPHSSFPSQQKPYVVCRKNGKTLDKSGNSVLRDAPEAHIPIEEFIFIGD